jgi:hypothetical protein
MKHQEDTGDRKGDEKKARNSSETESIGESKTMALHLSREDMEEEVLIDHHRAFQIGIRYSGSEDGTPNC